MVYTLNTHQSSNSTKASLDKIQNHAILFISGALRSTPTDGCEIHTHIEPVSLRREAVVVKQLKATSGYKRTTQHIYHFRFTPVTYQHPPTSKPAQFPLSILTLAANYNDIEVECKAAFPPSR